MITVSLVEDNVKSRDTVSALLRKAPELTLVSTHASGEDALQFLPPHRPRVILMDINLPGMSGIECVSQLKARLPESDVLMLTNYDDPEEIFGSLRAGAVGYLLKTMSGKDIIDAIEQVAEGGVPMPPAIARKVMKLFNQMPQPAPEVEALSIRERQILGLLSKGQPYKGIADELSICYGTVRCHVQAIYRKLHVRSRPEAVLKYLGK